MSPSSSSAPADFARVLKAHHDYTQAQKMEKAGLEKKSVEVEYGLQEMMTHFAVSETTYQKFRMSMQERICELEQAQISLTNELEVKNTRLQLLEGENTRLEVERDYEVEKRKLVEKEIKRAYGRLELSESSRKALQDEMKLDKILEQAYHGHIVDIQLEYGIIFDHALNLVRHTQHAHFSKAIEAYRKRYLKTIEAYELDLARVEVAQKDAEWWKQLRRSRLLLETIQHIARQFLKTFGALPDSKIVIQLSTESNRLIEQCAKMAETFECANVVMIELYRKLVDERSKNNRLLNENHNLQYRADADAKTIMRLKRSLAHHARTGGSSGPHDTTNLTVNLESKYQHDDEPTNRSIDSSAEVQDPQVEYGSGNEDDGKGETYKDEYVEFSVPLEANLAHHHAVYNDVTERLGGQGK